MTTVMFTDCDGELVMQADGHAGFNKDGPDIVCAACSALIYTLAQYVAFEEEGGGLSFMTCELSDGRAEIRLRPHESAKERVGAVFSAVKMGYEMLHKKYPEYVNVVG